MIVFGKNSVNEIFKSNKKIQKLYITENNMSLIKNIKIDQSVIKVMSYNQMNLQFKGNHQGIACEIEDYQYANLKTLIDLHRDDQNVSLVMLDSLEDPHNLGAILRSADATGMNGIIIPKNRSVTLNSTVAKVSTGAIEYVPVCQVTNLVQTIKELKKAGYWIIGLEADGSSDYRTQDYNGKIVVIIGSEGKGISRLVKTECDFLVNIPMVGHVNSLNASVSASLIFYEILRGRNN